MLSAIYLRLSRDEEQKGIEEILSTHRKALIKLANRENLKYEIFEEISSGKNNERPELNKLLERISDFDFVLVMDQDRLTRDNIYALQLKQKFILNEIKILTPSGAIDFEKESDDLSYSFKSMLAEYEWKSIRKRMGRGRLAAAGEGKWVGSNKTPLGYDKNQEKRLVIREDEAKIIRFIFEKISKGFSSNAITRELDSLKWRSRQGKVLTTSHIASIRVNPVYYGVVSMKRRVNGKVVDEVFVEDAHEGIISKQEFLNAQKVWGERNNEFRQKGGITRKLQGLIYCNCCGRKRYIQCDGTGTDFIKTCTYKITNNSCKDKGFKYLPIETAVLNYVKNLKPQIEQELETLKNSDTSSAEKRLTEQKSDLQSNLKKLENRKKNFVIMRSDGDISKQEYEELRSETEEKINQISQQIELLTMQIENLSNKDDEKVRLERVISYIDRIEDLDAEEANAFLKTFIKKVKFSSNMSSNHNTKDGREEPTLDIEFFE